MIPVPADHQSSIELADWVELSTLLSPSAQISRSDTIDQLVRYEVSGADDLTTDIWLELQRRANRHARLYPFQVHRTRIAAPDPWQSTALYTCLVAMATSTQHRQTRFAKHHEPAELFERITLLALARYVGGPALRIGHPRREPIPTSFERLLAYLADHLGETLHRSKPLLADTKDLKGDVVAWRPFHDRRGNQLVVFAQCGIGQNWRDKLSDLNLDVWKRYLDFVCKPVKAFSFPYVVPDEAAWMQYGTQAGIAFDRFRLVEMLREFPTPTRDERAAANALKTDLIGWTRTQLSRIPWD